MLLQRLDRGQKRGVWRPRNEVSGIGTYTKPTSSKSCMVTVVARRGCWTHGDSTLKFVDLPFLRGWPRQIQQSWTAPADAAKFNATGLGLPPSTCGLSVQGRRPIIPHPPSRAWTWSNQYPASCQSVCAVTKALSGHAESFSMDH